MEEWYSLITFLGGDEKALFKLKSKTDWKNNMNGTDIFGFKGLPFGYRVDYGTFIHRFSAVCWWSSSENTDPYGFARNGVGKNKAGFAEGYQLGLEVANGIVTEMGSGMSVRCLKD